MNDERFFEIFKIIWKRQQIHCVIYPTICIQNFQSCDLSNLIRPFKFKRGSVSWNRNWNNKIVWDFTARACFCYNFSINKNCNVLVSLKMGSNLKKNAFNRYRRGLETCLLGAESKILAFTFERFRLYQLKSILS